MKESVVFYKSFFEAIQNIPSDEQLKLYNAIFQYSFTDNMPELEDGIAKAMFILMKPNIDSANARYTSSVENGKKGGRPKKETQIKPNNNPKETQIKPNNNPKETQIKPNNNPKETQIKPNNNLNDNVDDNYNYNDNVDDNNIIGDSCVDGLKDIIDFYNNNINPITPYVLDELESYSKDMEKDLIILAMQKAVESNARNIKYIKAILKNWKNKGFKTVIEVKNEENKFNDDKKNNNEKSKQRDYDKDFLNSFYAN